MQYNLQLNLQKIATLNVAILFWEKKEVKEKITALLESTGTILPSDDVDKWHELTKTIIDKWSKDLLPRKLEIELIHTIKMVGQAIFDWSQHIKHANTFQSEMEQNVMQYINVIHWTPYGTVNGSKVLKSYWMNNPNLNSGKVYNFACSYALTEHINNLWNKIPKNIQDKYDEDVHEKADRHILTYWEGYRKNDFTNSIDCLNNFVRRINMDDPFPGMNISLEIYMLFLTVYKGHYHAMKYFWEKLTEEQQNNNVLECARIAVKKHYYLHEYDDNYRKSQLTEICIFMINKMSKVQKNEFFNDSLFNDNSYLQPSDKDVRNKILAMLLAAWPWQELFIPVLTDILQYQSDDNRMTFFFLNRITNNMCVDNLLGYSFQGSKNQSLLHEAWLIIPGFVKQNMLCEDLSQVVSDLISLYDVNSLKLIINDPDVASIRTDLIHSGLKACREFISDDKFEKLDRLIDIFFKLEGEKKDFKKLIDHWDSVLCYHFYLADKYLEWACSTPEEKKSIKNHICAISICENLISRKCYDLADKFLDWKFETKEEKKQLKDSLLKSSYYYSIENIFSTWCQCRHDTEKAKEESTQFLLWFLESTEKIISYKREEMVNLLMSQSDSFSCLNLYELGTLDEFLCWCLLDNDNINQIKKNLSELLEELTMDSVMMADYDDEFDYEMLWIEEEP